MNKNTSVKSDLTRRIVELLKGVPPGRVASYGQVAAMAGNPRASRVVVTLLNTVGRREQIPWFRIVNSKGTISLRKGHGYEEQKQKLEAEGIVFDENDRIDLAKYQWRG